MDNIKQKGFLSGNMLKLIGALLMLVDHIGLFMTEYDFLRIIGRLSFPVFAFMIAEGARYTKNKPKYFIGIFALGVICQAATYIYNESTYMCILITFSISVILIYSFQKLKNIVLDKCTPDAEKIRWIMLFVILVLGVYFINLHIEIDYGFWGCMLPLLISAFHGMGESLDTKRTSLVMLFAGLVLVSASLGGIQWYSLLSVPLIAMYSGKRGRYNMKYLFYIFYPFHLAVLQLIFTYI